MSSPHPNSHLHPHPDVEIVERTVGYRGYAELQQIRLRHKLHRGGWSPVISREMIERGHAVAVLPYDPVRDEVVLIRQFRVGALGAGRDPWLVETVAGIIDAGESGEDVARREAVEEAGCTIGTLFPVCEYYASPGVLTELLTVYVGIADSSSAGGIHGLPDEGEDIEAFVLPWAEAWAALQSGRFLDSKIIVTLQWLALNRADLRTRFGART